MTKILAGVIAALLLSLAASGWALKASIAKKAQAQQEAAQLRQSLADQVAETATANRRYLDLDIQFMALNKRKVTIREVVKTEFRYIREKAKTDETVAHHLNAGIPGPINCLLNESCGSD